MNRHFSKEAIQMTNVYMKRHSALLIIASQNHNEILLIPVGWLLSKNKSASVTEEVAKLEHFYTVGRVAWFLIFC